jgi:hypothetical protein
MFLSAKPHHGPDEIAVIEAMKSHTFNFAGSIHSYWDFYYGYGLFAAFNLLIETGLFWQLATLAKTEPARTRPIVALFALSNLGYGLLCWKYFFITPIVPDIAVAICLGFAFLAAKPRPA